MAREVGWCQTLADVYEASRGLSEAQAARLVLAACRCYYDGEGTEGLSRTARAILAGYRLSLARARARRLSNAPGGSDG